MGSQRPPESPWFSAHRRVSLHSSLALWCFGKPQHDVSSSPESAGKAKQICSDHAAASNYLLSLGCPSRACLLRGADVGLSTRKLLGALSLPETDCVGTREGGWWHLYSLVRAPGPAGPTSPSPAHHGAQLRDLFCLACMEQLCSLFSHATVCSIHW